MAPGGREREEARSRTGFTGRRSGLRDAHEVLARHEEALEIARSRGDEVAVGEALTRIGTQLAVTGEAERSPAKPAEGAPKPERAARPPKPPETPPEGSA